MLILASQSQARKSLLLGAGFRFDTVAADIDERAVESAARRRGADAAGVAVILAEAKARNVAATRLTATVIAADQTLALDDTLLHKPASLAEARRQLWALRGRKHLLHAGVALAVSGQVVWSAVETAELTLREFSEAECDAVLEAEGDAALGSVGGYRLEGPSIRLFESLRGDYFTILGLPLLPLLGALRQHAADAFDKRSK